MVGSPSECGINGVWRSLVAHLVWDQRVVGSSPTTPTNIVFNYGVVGDHDMITSVLGSIPKRLPKFGREACEPLLSRRCICRANNTWDV
jgi:hypothetical protein